MAEKIVLELKDKEFVVSHVSGNTLSQNQNVQQIMLPATLIENITGTLQNMWYQSRDIERVLSGIPSEHDTVEEILPYMIRELS